RRQLATALYPAPESRPSESPAAAPRGPAEAALPHVERVRGDARLRTQLFVLRRSVRLGPAAAAQTGRRHRARHPAATGAAGDLYRFELDRRQDLRQRAIR